MVIKCMRSWQSYLPGYQFKLWDELTFDVNSNQFVREAYSRQKWAFVSDYVRLFALFHEGGVYLDTDMEVCKCLDEFLDCTGFGGFESSQNLQAGIIGAQKGCKWIQRMLDYYDHKMFIQDDDSLELTTSPQVLTDISLNEFGFKPNNQYQVLTDDIHIYPKEFFCIDTGIVDCYTKHHYIGSWMDRKDTNTGLACKKLYMALNNLLMVSDEDIIVRLKGLDLVGRNIAFCGTDAMLRLLCRRLNPLNLLNTVCFISSEAGGKSVEGLPVINLQQIEKYAIDAIILIPVVNFSERKCFLKRIFAGRILSVEDLLDDYVVN